MCVYSPPHVLGSSLAAPQIFLPALDTFTRRLPGLGALGSTGVLGYTFPNLKLEWPTLGDSEAIMVGLIVVVPFRNSIAAYFISINWCTQAFSIKMRPIMLCKDRQGKFHQMGNSVVTRTKTNSTKQSDYNAMEAYREPDKKHPSQRSTCRPPSTTNRNDAAWACSHTTGPALQAQAGSINTNPNSHPRQRSTSPPSTTNRNDAAMGLLTHDGTGTPSTGRQHEDYPRFGG